MTEVVDDLLITAGIGVLIVRQFIWRTAELSRMLWMPAIAVAAGLAYLVVELRAGFHWVGADWLVVAELAMVAITGTVIGYATRFRKNRDRLQYRLTGLGLLPWVVFVAVRVGNFWLAGTLGADLADTSGLILLSFGVNRLTAITVVRHRAKALGTAATPQQEGIM